MLHSACQVWLVETSYGSCSCSSDGIIICHWSLLWCILLPLFWLSLDEEVVWLAVCLPYHTAMERGCMENVCLLKTSPASGHIFYSFNTLFNDMLFPLVAFLLYVRVFCTKGCKWWVCESASTKLCSNKAFAKADCCLEGIQQQESALEKQYHWIYNHLHFRHLHIAAFRFLLSFCSTSGITMWIHFHLSLYSFKTGFAQLEYGRQLRRSSVITNLAKSWAVQ